MITTIKIHDGFDVESTKEIETSLSIKIKQVLNEKDYNKLLPIIEYLDMYEDTYIKEVMDSLDIPKSSAQRYLAKLVKIGYVTVGYIGNKIFYKKSA